ncbi:MAG: septum formation initiator family protein [Spirochaetales bacterium]|nr:septum formation initiator family protein [Spirochaetales bacterium]
MLRKFIWSIYAGFILFALIQLFSGSVGFTNMKRINNFKANLENHVENLEIKSNKLEDEINRLTNNVDRLILAARPLGFIEHGQKMIKILNNEIDNSLYKQDVQFQIPTFERNSNTILLVSSLFTVILFVISLFIGVILDTFKRK